jgi:hypothetical protein
MKRGVWLLFMALGACEEAQPGAQERLAWDSAGVAVVEESAPYPGWSLSSTPVVRIGVVSGDPEYQLSKVAYAARLSGGGVVLVDGGSSEVRWYDTEGRFRSRAGGAGRGPGELLNVGAAALTPEDTVVLYDSRNVRLSWFAPDGTVSQTRRLELGPGSTVALYALQRGQILIAEERINPNLGGNEYNLARDSLLVLLTSSARDDVVPVMRLAGREAMTWVDYVGGTPVGTRQMKLPLGQVTLAGGTGNRIAVIRSGHDELALFDETGTLVRLARRSDVDPPQISSSLRQAYVADYVEWAQQVGLSAASAKTAAEDQLDLLPEGRAVPAFDRLLTDAAAEQIWLRDYLPERVSHQARNWTVHDLSGQVVAQVTTPPGFDLMHIGTGHLTGLERDEMGVEYVVVYALE